MINTLKKTEKTYGFLWRKGKDVFPPERWHFNSIEEAVGSPIVSGRLGIDVGSGCGYDTYIMARNNPSVRIISMDISDGVYKTKNYVSKLSNVYVVKGSALNIPIKDNTCDFAYSFGVLHHTCDPERGLKEIKRVIKNKSTAYLYLYEDQSEHPVKYFALRVVNLLRRMTVKTPQKILYAICFLFSPLVVISFSWPARILRRFKKTIRLSEKIPFNFGTHFFSLSADLYDRFGAPVEYRFSRKQVQDLLSKNGFLNIRIGKMQSTAGWVAWGIKAND